MATNGATTHVNGSGHAGPRTPPDQQPSLRTIEIGSRVAGVLAAAEQAAAELIADAHADAEQRRSQLEDEIERIRAEAEDYANDVTLAVDAYAARCRREAEAEADRILIEARERAAEIEATARRRQEEIAIETGAIESRRSRAVKHLQQMAAAIANLEAAATVEELELSELPRGGH